MQVNKPLESCERDFKSIATLIIKCMSILSIDTTQYHIDHDIKETVR